MTVTCHGLTRTVTEDDLRLWQRRERTKELLIAAGVPPSTIPDSTIEYFLKHQWAPDRIVRELWGICPQCHDHHLGAVES